MTIIDQMWTLLVCGIIVGSIFTMGMVAPTYRRKLRKWKRREWLRNQDYRIRWQEATSFHLRSYQRKIDKLEQHVAHLQMMLAFYQVSEDAEGQENIMDLQEGVGYRVVVPLLPPAA